MSCICCWPLAAVKSVTDALIDRGKAVGGVRIAGRIGRRGKDRDVLDRRGDRLLVGARAIGDGERVIDLRDRGPARRIRAHLAGVPGDRVGRRAGDQRGRGGRRSRNAHRRLAGADIEEIVRRRHRGGRRQRGRGELADRRRSATPANWSRSSAGVAPMVNSPGPGGELAVAVSVN